MKYIDRVGVRVIPDTRDFDKLKHRFETQKMPIEAVLDSSRFRQEMAELHDDGRTIRIRAEAEGIDRLQQQVRQVRGELDRLDQSSKVTVDVATEGLENARAELNSVLDQLKEYDTTGQRAELELDQAMFLSQLNAAKAALASLDDPDPLQLKLQADVESAKQAVAEAHRLMNDGVQKSTWQIELETDIDETLQKLEILKAEEARLRQGKRKSSHVTTEIREVTESLRGMQDQLSTLKYDEAVDFSNLIDNAAEAEMRLASLDAQMDALHKERETMKIRVDADIEEAQRKLSEAERALEDWDRREDVSVKLNADADEVYRELARARRELDAWNRDSDTAQVAHIRVLADVDDAKRELDTLRAAQKQLASTDDAAISIRVNTREAEERLRGLEAQLKETAREVDRTNLTVKFGATGVRELEAQLAQIESQLDGLRDDSRAKIQLESNAEELRRNLAEARQELEAVQHAASQREQLEVKLVTDLSELTHAEARLRDLKEMTREEYEVKLRGDHDDLTGRIDTLRDQIRQIKAETSFKIQVDLDEARNNVAQLRRDLKAATTEENKLQIKADLTDAYREVDRLKGSLKNDPIDATVHLEADLAELKRELKSLEDELSITAEVDLDKGAATAQLALFTRPRTLTILAKITGLDQAERMIKGLTGANMLGRLRDQFTSLFSNMDTLAYRMAGAAAGFVTLGSSIINAIGGATNVIHGLVTTVPALLTFVPALGAITAAVAVAVMAFNDLSSSSSAAGQDFYSAWTGVRDELDAIKTNVQDSFFGQGAATELRELATVLLPQLDAGFQKLAVTMGRGFTDALKAVREFAQTEDLGKFFTNADKGTSSFIKGLEQIFLGLSKVGIAASDYLPGMGKWVEDLGTKFNKWASDTDNVNDAIERGRVQLGHLKDIGSSTIGIFEALWKAANNGETTGLEGLSRELQRLEGFLKSDGIQNGLSGLFRGAEEAFKNITVAVGNSNDAIGQLLESMGRVLGNFSTGFSSGLESAFKAFANPEVTTAFEELGTALGNIFRDLDWDSVAGTLGGLANTLSALAPHFTDVLNAVLPLINDVFKEMPAIIRELDGPLKDLAAGLKLVADAASATLPMMTDLLSGLNDFISTITRGGGWLELVFPEQTQMSMIMLRDAIKSAFPDMDLGPLDVFADFAIERQMEKVAKRAMDAFGTGLTQFDTEETLNTIALPLSEGLAKSLKTAAADAAWELETGLSRPIAMPDTGVGGVNAAFAEIPKSAKAATDETQETMRSGFGGVVDTVRSSLADLGETMRGKWDEIVSTAREKWNEVKAAIQERLSEILAAIRERLTEIVTAAREKFTEVVTTVRERLTELISTARERFTELVSAARERFTELVSAARERFTELVEAGRERLGELVSAARERFTELVSAARERLGELVSAARERFTELVSAARERLGELVSAARERFTELVEAARERLGELVSAARERFTELVEAARERLGELVSAARERFTELVSAARERLGELVSAARERFTEVVSAARERFGELVSTGRERFGELVSAGRERFGELVSTARERFGELVSTGRERFGELVSTGRERFGELVSTGRERFGELVSTGRERFGELVSTGRERFTELVSAARERFSEMVSTASSRFSEMTSTVSSRLGEMVSTARSRFGEMVSAASSQLGQIAGTVTSTMGNAANAMRSSAQTMMQNLTSAIQSGRSSAISAISSLPGQLASSISAGAGAMRSAGASLMQGLVDGINSMIGSIRSAAASARAAAESARYSVSVEDAAPPEAPSMVAFGGPSMPNTGIEWFGPTVPDIQVMPDVKALNASTGATTSLTGTMQQLSKALTAARGPAYQAATVPMSSAGAAGQGGAQSGPVLTPTLAGQIATELARMLAPAMDQELASAGARTERGAG